MSFFDFNDADQQQSFDLIPKGTLVRLRMTLKPGGFDDPAQGWTGGWATQSEETGSVYLACEGVVLEGPYARRRIWWNIGLFSAKGPAWGNMGRTFIRAALHSARHIHPADNGPQAQAARRLNGFGDLDGLEFAARIDIERDARGNDRNTVKAALEPDHRDHALIMGATTQAAPVTSAPYTPPAQTAARPAASAPAAAPLGKPSWAQ